MIARALIGLLLVLFAVQAGMAAREDSVTVDEFVHLPIGLYMVRQRDFTPDPINPPLSRMLPALAVAPSPDVVAPSFNVNHWGMGLEFMDRNFDSYQTIFVRARCVVIVMSILLGALVCRFAFALYGQAASVIALLLFVFSPSFLAHGHLVTTDVAGALGFTATVYSLWRYLDSRSVLRAAVLGLAFGVALLLKLSSLLLAAVILLCAAIDVLRAEGQPRLRLAFRLMLGLCVACVAATLVIDLGYGFEGVGRSLQEVDLRSGGAVAALDARYPWLRIPLPAPFLTGLDLAMTGRDSLRTPYYLAGTFSETGWWYYHLVAFALKTPLPILLASIFVLASLPFRRDRRRNEHCLLVAALAVFVVNGVFNPLNIGVRHVLAAEPLLLVLISPLFAAPIARFLSGPPSFAVAARAAASVLALAWLIAGTLRVSPRYLQYFNEAAGGPANGHAWLTDSNLDWGQDLIRLSRYMEEKHLPSIALAYMGTVHPWVYGIHFTPLTRDSHGPAAISASTLTGSTYAIWSEPGRHAGPSEGEYVWLRGMRPVARVGSMFIFDLP